MRGRACAALRRLASAGGGRGGRGAACEAREGKPRADASLWRRAAALCQDVAVRHRPLPGCLSLQGRLPCPRGRWSAWRRRGAKPRLPGGAHCCPPAAWPRSTCRHCYRLCLAPQAEHAPQRLRPRRAAPACLSTLSAAAPAAAPAPSTAAAAAVVPPGASRRGFAAAAGGGNGAQLAQKVLQADPATVDPTLVDLVRGVEAQGVPAVARAAMVTGGSPGRGRHSTQRSAARRRSRLALPFGSPVALGPLCAPAVVLLVCSLYPPSPAPPAPLPRPASPPSLRPLYTLCAPGINDKAFLDALAEAAVKALPELGPGDICRSVRGALLGMAVEARAAGCGCGGGNGSQGGAEGGWGWE